MNMFHINNKFYYVVKTKLIRSSVLNSATRHIFSVTGELPKTKLFKESKDGTPSVSRQIEAKWKKVLASIEKKRQDTSSILRCKENHHKKKYILSMFPYPSGHLHMGHVRVYTISDIIAKYYKLNGYQVLHPIGWDAFGLPAENAARERDIPADSWTYSNIDTMRKQLSSFGCNFNWEYEITTCSPEYFKWTQYIFSQLYKAGLAYQQEASVNWDPVDQTVLANEQVDSKGRSWRSGVKVEKKSLKQWFIEITKYNHYLLESLNNPCLKNWDIVGKIQQQWIGKCDGYRIIFNTVDSNDEDLPHNKLFAWVKDTKDIQHIPFIGINKEHSLNIPKYYDLKKEDYTLLNVKAKNPITHTDIPIIVSDSFKFIKTSTKHIASYYIPNKKLSQQDEIITTNFNITVPQLSDKEFKNNIEILQQSGNGGYQCSFFSKDWLVSRQRYWGTPIPIVHCDSCGTVPVPEEQLPVLLPSLSKSDSGQKLESLKDFPEWVNCTCPRCGNSAKRETDTLDTFVDSSWYFLRFTDPHNLLEPFSKQNADYFMPVDVYIGGIEHALLHLYYSRFFQIFFHKNGLVSHEEPFKTLLMIGQVKGPTYKVKRLERYLPASQVNTSKKPFVEKSTGEPVVYTVEKMGKSKSNGVNPQDIVDEFGVDSTRLMMVTGVHPFDPLTWSTSTHYRQYQMRLYGLVIEFFKKRNGEDPLKDHEYLSDELLDEERKKLVAGRNHYIDIIQNHMEDTLNISAVVENLVLFTRMLVSETPRHVVMTDEFEYCVRDLLVMLSPIIPHLANELWVMFTAYAVTSYTDKTVPLTQQPWPRVQQECTNLSKDATETYQEI